MAKKERPKTINILLRLPPELHAALKRWAQEERRPLNWQIVRVLELALAERETQQPPPAQSS